MKFLVDAHLPKSLSALLINKGYDSIHTLQLPDKNATTDIEINRIALAENRVVISKDNDFLETHMVNKIPPKLLLIVTGNITNDMLLGLFDQYLDTIVANFETSDLLLLTKENLVAK